MKKIININLSGRVIPIEDSAYEKLQAYIESLRRYFVNEEGRDEIINDIESRIAELMNDKVRKGAQAVSDEDLDEIIASMGRPEDFEAAEAETNAGATSQGTQQEYTQAETKTKKRLYRDSSDKFIGGVCSGIANYLNTDPAIVRILFAIITFGGFGLGFLLYILLWMFLPTSDLEVYSGKRLFRNPDNRIIGGVAGGLSAYFNMRASVIRLIFIAPILLSIFINVINDVSWRHGFHFFPNIVFGSLSGTFILAYIVLWIVLPEASSPYEKMEMRGEKVDVNTIRQNVKEGMSNVKDKMKGWSDEVKQSAQNISSKAKEFANTKGKDFAKEVKETTRRSGRGIGHAIAVLFKVFFLFIAGTIAFGLFVAVIALIFGGVAWWPINNFLWTSKWQQLYAWGTLIFFLGVPLIGFIIWVIRRIIRVRSRSGYLGWTFGGLWLIGWIAATLFAVSISQDFRYYEHSDVSATVSQPPKSKMIVTVSEPELEFTGNFGWMDDSGERGWDLTDDTIRMSTVRFNVVASKDSLYYVTMKKYSYGKTEEEAMDRSEKIKYAVLSKDSVLDLANGYAIGKEEKFRFQQVEIEIQVPVGKKLRFDESVNYKLHQANFKFRRRYKHNGVVDIRVDEDVFMNRFRPNIDYVMGIDGILRDPEGKTIVKDYYRYQEDDSVELKNQIEQKKQELKELQEKQDKQKNKPTGYQQKSANEKKNEDVAGLLSPVLSLIGI